MLEQLYTIVNTRYEDGKALLLTTNLDHAGLVTQIGERTVSRIYEICGDPLPMWGDDERRSRAFVLPDASPRDEETEWERPAPSQYGRWAGGPRS